MPLFPEIVRRLCGPLSRRGDGKWFALAAAFLVVNAWLAWNLVHTGGVQAPGAGSGAAGGVSVAPTPPLKLISATQASYDGANNTAVLKLTFNLPPSPQQFERAVTLVRVGSTGAPVHFEMCGGIRSPDVLIRTRDPVHGGEQLLVTVCKGLAAAGNAPPTDSEQRLPVPVSESFQIGEIDPQSPPFEPCRVQVSFGRRIDPADAAVAIAVQPAVKLDISEHYDGCTVAGDFQPGTSYAFTFRKGLKAADGTRLAEDAERTVIFPDRAAALSLAVDGNFLSPRGALNVPVLAMNVRTCETALRRVCRGNVVFYANRTDRYDRCNRSSRFGRDSVRSLTEPAVTNVVALPERPNREHKFYVNLRTLAGAQPTGVYSLSVSARDSLPRSYRDYDYGESDCAERLVVVTDLGLTARMGLDGVLVWVNALRTAQPAADVEVTLYARNNMELARARTDAQGLAFLPCRADLPEEQQPTLATAAQGDDLSYLRLSEERPFQDACGDAYLNGGCEAFVFSERGVYRPGETVHAETLVRDADLQPPAPFPVLLRVVKPDGRTFRDLPATLSARGAAEFSLELPAYLPTGIYGLHVVMPGTGRELGRTSVSLEEFVPPQIAVTLDQLPARLRTDERLPVDVGARHLFGSPAAGLPVSASVYLRDIPFKPAAWAGYTFGDAEKPALKRAFQLGERHLDVDGRCAFTNDALGPLAPAGALLATVCATVSDSGGRGVSAYASTLVDAYPFYIGIKPPGASTHARVGTALVLGVIAVSPDGRACQPGAPLLATVERVAWTGVMRRNNGHYVWQSERTKIKVGEPVRVALRDGAGTYAFTAADTGDYLVTLTDPASGASSSVELFASAADAAWVDWARDKPAAAQLSLDRPDYAPGQKAKLALKAPFGGTALLTI